MTPITQYLATVRERASRAEARMPYTDKETVEALYADQKRLAAICEVMDEALEKCGSSEAMYMCGKIDEELRRRMTVAREARKRAAEIAGGA